MLIFADELSGNGHGRELTQAALDYHRIEKAIGFLEEHFLEQPDLAAVARAVHISEHHFQRLFTRWAGISPKRFLQFLTIEHAKTRLAASKAILETALDSGLSGPGRLHDLFVSVEAVTPGEFKTRGGGLRIDYGFQPTPFGWCLLGITSRGICWFSFAEKPAWRQAVEEMKAHWSGARFAENPQLTATIAERVFSSPANSGKEPLTLLVMGTNFQLKVWQALLKIPLGTVTNYENLARSLGCPKASRAVGAAVGQNAIAYLIPCHRVIRKSGLLGDYRWGAVRKQALVGWEAARAAA